MQFLVKGRFFLSSALGRMKGLVNIFWLRNFFDYELLRVVLQVLFFRRVELKEKECWLVWCRG